MFTNGFINVSDCLDRKVVHERISEGLYRPPSRAYSGQELAPMMRKLQQPGDEDGKPTAPAAKLDLITVRNGWFAVGNGLDGVVLTEDRRMISQMAAFSNPGRARQAEVELDTANAETQFEDVFVGFDAAWTNWYHWLCFALARSALGARLLPRACPIVLPDYAVRASSTDIRFSEVTWRQSLEAFGLRGRVTLLPPGVYRAETIRFLWTTPKQPTNLTLFPAFHELFAAVRDGLRKTDEWPRRILISREARPDPRLTPEETAELNRVAARYGFSKVFFEKMDFAAQIETMFNAEAVLAVHGAGLANLLFAQSDIKILEIAAPVDNGTDLRPWIYQIANERRLSYRFLNSVVGDVTERGIVAALGSLGLSS